MNRYEITSQIPPNFNYQIPPNWWLTWPLVSLLTTVPAGGPVAPRPPGGLLLLRGLHGEHEVVLVPGEESLVVSLAVHLTPSPLTASRGLKVGSVLACSGCSQSQSLQPLHHPRSDVSLLTSTRLVHSHWSRSPDTGPHWWNLPKVNVMYRNNLLLLLLLLCRQHLNPPPGPVWGGEHWTGPMVTLGLLEVCQNSLYFTPAARAPISGSHLELDAGSTSFLNPTRAGILKRF